MTTSRRKRWSALAALAVAVLVVGLDATVLSVALPTLATDLRASTVELQWIVNAYLLVLAAALLPGGLLGDRFGRKKMLLITLVVFGVGSLGCAYAGSAGLLIAARTVLGLGAAFMIPLVLSVITVLFPKEERARAVGVWAAATFVALPIGPIFGGWLLDNFWWGSVFLINLPVVILAMIAVVALVPESRSGERRGLDPVGVASSSLGWGALTYGPIEAGEDGWLDAGALAPLIAGLAMLVAFWLWERRLGRRPGGQPLVDLGLFSSAGFTGGTILAGAGVFAMFGVLFALSQYFQAILGTDAMGSGLRLLPLIVGLMIGAGSADRLAARAGTKVTVALGFALMAAGTAAGGTTGMGTSYGFMAAWTTVAGIGTGLVMATASSAVLATLSTERSGVGSAVMQTVQKVGGPLGVATLGSLLNSGYHSRLDLAGLPAQAADAVRESIFAGVALAQELQSAPLLVSVRSAFVHGMDVMLWVSAGVAAAAIAGALIFLPRRVATGTGEAEPTEMEEKVLVSG